MAAADARSPLLSGAPAAKAAPRALPAPRLATFSTRGYALVLLVLVLFNVADNVLVVVLFDEFPEELAQYVNQGTAFVYIVWSSAILLVQGACRARGRRCRCFWDHEEHGAASRARSTAPWYILVGIGLFNGSGNFCMALAQPHTSGLTQTLLNLLGIPLVLVLSWVFLRKPSSRLAVGGAILIVIGTACSSLRSEFEPSSGAASPVALFVWAPFLYAAGQLFLGGEKVWEEHSFVRFRGKIDPMTMFWYTLVTQFCLGWALYPLQTFPELGNITLSKLPTVIETGVLCTLGNPVSTSIGRCSWSNTLIFFVYCSVDFWCYFFGLWVIQLGGANLMVMATAVALPLQQLVLCSPLMFSYEESFFGGDAVALLFVIVGFAVFQCSREGRESRGSDNGEDQITRGGYGAPREGPTWSTGDSAVAPRLVAQ